MYQIYHRYAIKQKAVVQLIDIVLQDETTYVLQFLSSALIQLVPSNYILIIGFMISFLFSIV